MKFTLETIAAPAANEQNIDALIASLENMQAAQASLEAWGYSDRWKRAFDPEGILVAMTGIEPSVESFAEGVKNTIAKIIEWIKVFIKRLIGWFTGDGIRLKKLLDFMKNDPKAGDIFKNVSNLESVAVFTASHSKEKHAFISFPAARNYITHLSGAPLAVNFVWDATDRVDNVIRDYNEKAEKLSKKVFVDAYSVFDNSVGLNIEVATEFFGKFEHVGKRLLDAANKLEAEIATAKNSDNGDPSPLMQNAGKLLTVMNQGASMLHSIDTCAGIMRERLAAEISAYTASKESK